MKTYSILYDPEDNSFKIGDMWTFDLSEGDVEAPLELSHYLADTLTLPTTCRTNEDFLTSTPNT